MTYQQALDEVLEERGLTLSPHERSLVLQEARALLRMRQQARRQIPPGSPFDPRIEGIIRTAMKSSRRQIGGAGYLPTADEQDERK